MLGKKADIIWLEESWGNHQREGSPFVYPISYDCCHEQDVYSNIFAYFQIDHTSELEPYCSLYIEIVYIENIVPNGPCLHP